MAAGRVLQIKRGLHATLGTLNAGELFFETDTHVLYVGDGAANHAIYMEEQATAAGLDLLNYLFTTRLAIPEYVTESTPIPSIPLFDVLRADRLAFLPASQIIIEKSTDAGATWVDAGVSNTNKVGLFSGARPYLEIPLLNGIRSTNCMLRITITAQQYSVPVGTAETDKYNYWTPAYYLSQERYTCLTDAWLLVSSIYDRIQCVIQSAPANDPTTWSTLCTAYLSGWPGGNYASFGDFGAMFGGAQSQTSQPWNIRFVFRTCSTTNTLNDADLSVNNNQAQYIHQIKATGQNVWTYSNQLMYTDHLYAWDVDKNATFPAKVTGTQIVSSVASGTAPLVVTSPTVVPNLNADTLDGNHAAAFAAASHSHAESDVADLTTHLAAKLPLAGGTMSGAINMGNQDISYLKLLKLNGEIDDGDSGTNHTIDLNTGVAHKIKLTGNTTLAFAGYGENLFLGGTATADDTYATYTPDRTINGNLGDYWETDTDPPHWLQVVVGTGISPTAYFLKGISSNQYPTAWSLAGSNNGTDWTTLDTRTTNDSLKDNAVHYYGISTPASYTYFKLTVTAFAGGYLRISEFGGVLGITDPVASCFITLKLVQDATGGRLVTWPSTVKGSPVINQAANAVSNVLFYWDGTSYWTLNGLPWVGVPASASAAGFVGQVAYDASYIYVCTAANTWKRVAIATW